MKTPVMAKVQSNGNVFCYDENGNYVCGQTVPGGKAVSAHINGSSLVIQSNNGKSYSYEIRNGSVIYKGSC